MATGLMLVPFRNTRLQHAALPARGIGPRNNSSLRLFDFSVENRGSGTSLHHLPMCQKLVPKDPMLFYQNKIISRKLETHPHAVQTCRGWLPTLSLLEEGIVVEIHSWSMNYENLWNVLQILTCTVLLSTYINNIESHWYIKLWMKENTQISGTGWYSVILPISSIMGRVKVVDRPYTCVWAAPLLSRHVLSFDAIPRTQ